MTCEHCLHWVQPYDMPKMQRNWRIEHGVGLCDIYSTHEQTPSPNTKHSDSCDHFEDY